METTQLLIVAASLGALTGFIAWRAGKPFLPWAFGGAIFALWFLPYAIWLNVKETRFAQRWPALTIAAIGAPVALLLLASLASMIETGGGKLPLCDSYMSRNTISDIFNNAKWSKDRGLSFIKITDVKEVSSQSNSRKCAGNIFASDSETYITTYEINLDADVGALYKANWMQVAH